MYIDMLAAEGHDGMGVSTKSVFRSAVVALVAVLFLWSVGLALVRNAEHAPAAAEAAKNDTGELQAELHFPERAFGPIVGYGLLLVVLVTIGTHFAILSKRQLPGHYAERRSPAGPRRDEEALPVTEKVEVRQS
jgi:hypothetical protein